MFYVGQKAFIEKNREILVLFLPDDTLDFPGGKIQEGETNYDVSLKREVKEETDMEIEVGPVFCRWSYQLEIGHKNAGRKVFLTGLKCRLLGGYLQLSNEHKSYKWVNKSNYRVLNDGSGHFLALETYFKTFQP